MIRQCSPAEIGNVPQDETGIRIQSLIRAYGPDAPFIQYYSDGVGGILAIIDGVGMFSSTLPLEEEWIVFIGMNPDIRQLHCPALYGRQIADSLGWAQQTGIVLRYAGQPVDEQEGVCHRPYLPAVYSLLEKEFPNLPTLNAWYPDASHRIRHGCCHIACVLDNDAVVSTAMTVAETDGAAIFGQVATAQTHRRLGLASRCIRSLISECKAKTLYILPLNQTAETLYINLGFVPDGEWAELRRT